MSKLTPVYLAAISLALSACATTKPPPPPKIVTKPIPVSCVPKDFPEAPSYPDSDAALKAAPDGPTRYLAIGAGRVLRIQRLNEVEAVIKACR